MLHRWGAELIVGWEQGVVADGDESGARVVLLGPAVAPGLVCREVIPSWGAATPPDSWIELQLRAFSNGRWSRFYRMACWDAAATGSGRCSFDAQRDDDGSVATDTLCLVRPAELLQARLLLCASEENTPLPQLTSLTLCCSSGEHNEAAAPTVLPELAPLDLPLYSQYAYPEEQGWCSPTSLAMVLGYWHRRTGDPRLAPFVHPESVPQLAAPMVYDPVWQGTGNWSFNVAYAASLGLEAYVARFANLEQVLAQVAAGVPVIFSLGWQPGDLDDVPQPRSRGHLIVITGSRDGRVLVADPAGQGAGVARAYRADQLAACWQRSSAGAVYLVYPPGWL